MKTVPTTESVEEKNPNDTFYVHLSKGGDPGEWPDYPALDQLKDLLYGPAGKDRMEKMRTLCDMAITERDTHLKQMRTIQQRSIIGRIRLFLSLFTRMRSLQKIE